MPSKMEDGHWSGRITLMWVLETHGPSSSWLMALFVKERVPARTTFIRVTQIRSIGRIGLLRTLALMEKASAQRKRSKWAQEGYKRLKDTQNTSRGDLHP